MKKLLSILLTLCVLVGIACLASITAFAAEEVTPIDITQADVSVEELTAGQDFPVPTVADDAGCVVSAYKWKLFQGAVVSNAVAPVEVKHYYVEITLTADDGYQFGSGGTWTVNGEPVTKNSFYGDSVSVSSSRNTLSIRKTFTLRTKLDRAEVTIPFPNIGEASLDTPVICAEPDKYTARIRDVSASGKGNVMVYEDGRLYYLSVYISAAEGYEFSEDSVLVVNGVETECSDSWSVKSFEYTVDLDQTVAAVELPAWPETVAPGPGGTQELSVPEGANYTLQSMWLDMRTGEEVQTLEAGDVYTLAYVAIPKGGFHFREETAVTLGGQETDWFGDESYMVLYKSYDLGAIKIDRVDVTLPQLIKGCTIGAASVPAGVNYELREIMWAESTTGSFDDAQLIESASFGTGVYAIPVLFAADGYTFSEDVKLYFNGVEVAVEDMQLEGPVLEIAGLYGTLTPPTTDGWHREDNTWAYYVGGQKRTNAWIADSIGWCYVDQNGLMVTNGWAKDSVGWCYLGADGYIVKNRWAKDSVGWCYMNAEGYVVYSKWIKDSIDWCYVGADGYMMTDAWIADSMGWCYVGSNGYMVRNAWVADSVGVCRLDKNGYIIYDQWIKDEYGWAYVDENGHAIIDDWFLYKGEWYAMGADGYMLTNSWITYKDDVYRIGSDGYMLTAQWIHDGYGWSYVDAEGKVPFESWIKDSGGTCYIGSGGYMLTSSWIKIDGKRYYVDENGHMLRNTTRTINSGYWPNFPTTYIFDSNGVATEKPISLY